jgi:non-ribosomal peptide synthetase component F
MDPRYPAQRLRFTAQNAGMPVIITTAAEFPPVPGIRLLTPAALTELGAGPSMADARVSDEGDDPAYVIYTSGSTGTPKGVVVPHRNVLALLRATTEDFALGPDDTWTLFHSSAFDFSVWEIWGCLLTGGRLVVVPYWTTRDTEEFYALLARQRVTVLNQTPSAFAQLVHTDQRVRGDLTLRLIIFGGEPLDVRMLAPWFAPGRRLPGDQHVRHHRDHRARDRPDPHPARGRGGLTIGRRCAAGLVGVHPGRTRAGPAARSLGRDLRRRRGGGQSLPRPARADRAAVHPRRADR